MLLVSGFSVLVFGDSRRTVCHFNLPASRSLKRGPGSVPFLHSAALQFARRSSKVSVW